MGLKDVIRTVGSSHHTEEDREEHDFYATDKIAVADFLTAFCDRDRNELGHSVWECACGEGNISDVLEDFGFGVNSSDLIDRGYQSAGFRVFDFLSEPFPYNGDILTNPPYKHSIAFIERALENVQENARVIMLFKVQFLASQKRRKLFEKYPLEYVYVHSKRIKILKNNKKSNHSNALDYAWFVWRKGFKGETTVRWI